MRGLGEGRLGVGGVRGAGVSEDVRAEGEMSVCDAPPEAPLLRKRFTHVMVVDGRSSNAKQPLSGTHTRVTEVH